MIDFRTPPETYLRTASLKAGTARTFKSLVFGGGTDSDAFVAQWVQKIHGFLIEALGPFGVEPLETIHPMSDGMHMSGATASFNLGTGQVTLCPSVEGNPGQILEKMTHELVHGAYAQFPSSNDGFYDEGFTDFSTWCLVHAPIYGEYRQQAIDAAAFNIKMRRERAARTGTDYDRKRWAGGCYASMFLGPMILHRMKLKKSEGDFTW